MRAEFFAVHVAAGGRQRAHGHWERALSEYVAQRMEDFAAGKRKQVKVAELRRLLQAGGAMLPERQVRFDGEGRIRPGAN